MYAIGGDDTHLTVRGLVDPAYATCMTLRKRYSALDITAASKLLTLYDAENGEHTIIRSVRPWVVDHVIESTPTHACSRRAGLVGVIGNRVFACVTSCRTNILLWDVSTPSRVASLCNVKRFGEELNIAEWRGCAWVSANICWSAQHPDSRELCTLVKLSAMDDMEYGSSIGIATGEGRLYGHCADIYDRECISALDPRESDVAREVYRDGCIWSWYDFRDVPNGVAVVPLCGQSDNIHINIFDERSCAMIGTDMFITYDEYLFCSPHTQLK
jgi:hypothetical protein